MYFYKEIILEWGAGGICPNSQHKEIHHGRNQK
jgi:hypothetical protein